MDIKANKQLFDKIEERTNVKTKDLLRIANQIEPDHFRSDQKVREVVKEITSLTNIPVSKDKESQIVDAVHSQFTSFHQSRKKGC